VHWARDAAEHNRIVHGLLRERGVTRLVKSKSMLTRSATSTSTWKRTASRWWTPTWRADRAVPARAALAHRHARHPSQEEEIGELFHQKLAPLPVFRIPSSSTEAARGHMREKFLAAQAGLTGVNFAVASTGGSSGLHQRRQRGPGHVAAAIHIACMGVEKMVPSRRRLAVFPPAAGAQRHGQPITTYTSHFQGPRPGAEMHIVIVDNGRSRILAREEYRNSLKCIVAPLA